MNNIVTINNIRGYVNEEGMAMLNAEDVARGFGFTVVTTCGNECIRWNRVNSYLKKFYFSRRVGKDDYLPENMVYRLGFKAKNETAIKFQSFLADEVLPSLRKHGAYITGQQEMTREELLAKAL